MAVLNKVVLDGSSSSSYFILHVNSSSKDLLMKLEEETVVLPVLFPLTAAPLMEVSNDFNFSSLY